MLDEVGLLHNPPIVKMIMIIIQSFIDCFLYTSHSAKYLTSVVSSEAHYFTPCILSHLLTNEESVS